MVGNGESGVLSKRPVAHERHGHGIYTSQAYSLNRNLQIRYTIYFMPIKGLVAPDRVPGLIKKNEPDPNPHGFGMRMVLLIIRLPLTA